VFRRKAPEPVANRWLIIGLGNPGRDYEDSRHNVGFLVIDELARRFGGQVRGRGAKSLTGQVRTGGRELVLAKPQTFMNLSGSAAKALRTKYNVPLERTFIVHDDIDLPFGRLRIRKEGSSAGHHGVDSLIEAFGTKAFVRFRVGVGRPIGDGIDYVLGPFTGQERELLPGLVSRAVDAVTMALEQGVDRAMTEFNKS
jgi:peptidyl-tRNA hydrolase, PTH1 family